MSAIKETDLAWAAGFIDGEGCIALRRQVGRQKGVEYTCYALRLSVTNTDLRCLERLKAMFAGSINRATHANRPQNKPCWTWYCSSANAERALCELLPYLLSKREQAELGMLSRKHIQKNGRKRESGVLEHQAAIADRIAHLKRVA